MRRAFAYATLSMLTMLAAACTTPPVPRSAADQAVIMATDAGPPPDNVDFATIKAVMAQKLRDAPSAQFAAPLPPRKQMITLRGENVVCWQWDVWINASNSYDGHRPYEPFSFFFRSGKMIAYEGSIPLPGDWRSIPGASG